MIRLHSDSLSMVVEKYLERIEYLHWEGHLRSCLKRNKHNANHSEGQDDVNL